MLRGALLRIRLLECHAEATLFAAEASEVQKFQILRFAQDDTQRVLCYRMVPGAMAVLRLSV